MSHLLVCHLLLFLVLSGTVDLQSLFLDFLHFGISGIDMLQQLLELLLILQSQQFPRLRRNHILAILNFSLLLYLRLLSIPDPLRPLILALNPNNELTLPELVPLLHGPQLFSCHPLLF